MNETDWHKVVKQKMVTCLQVVLSNRRFEINEENLQK